MFIYDVTMMENEKSIDHLITDRAEYHSFLLRIWKTKGHFGNKWYFSLENPMTHELISFQDQFALTHYLTQLFEKTQALSDQETTGDKK